MLLVEDNDINAEIACLVLSSFGVSAERAYQTLPILAMSANANDEDVKACLAAGMNAHISKPFMPEGLRKTLDEQILK